MDSSALGRVIRARRRQFGLRQAELAALSGVGNRFLSELENGKTTLELGRTLNVLTTLGLVLRVDERCWRDIGAGDAL